MLYRLSISNYALISSLSVQFDNNFSVITGETGAGKSILIGALGFVLGDRSDFNVLLDDSKKCVVEAVFIFDDERFKSFFELNDLDYNEECILRRELTPQKKSRSFINDTPVSLQLMKKIGNQLIDIHSQHDSLLLTDAGFQLGLLDNAAKNASLLIDYKNIYHSYISCRNELNELREKVKNNIAEYDFLKFQLDEILKADLQENEYEELSQRLEILENAEEIKNILRVSTGILEQNEFNVLSELNELISNMYRLRQLLPQTSSFNERLESVKIELKDISRDLDALQNDVQFDPLTLQILQERFDLIQHLMMKHHVDDYAQLLQIGDDIKLRVDEFTNIDEVLAKKEQELESLKRDLTKKSNELSKSRLAIKNVFEKDVTSIIRQLAMPYGVFEIQYETLSDFTVYGIDRVRFMFSANKGVAPDEMSRVASGGELSRLMLAIKRVAAKNNYIPTLIFDEIDSGVSGEVASKLGDIMNKMGENLQLISITHLPQIASKAKHHFFVYKDETKNKPYSCIKTLTEKERVVEIAKMLSNDKITDEALRASEVLLFGY